jgi:hypothetical protein
MMDKKMQTMLDAHAALVAAVIQAIQNAAAAGLSAGDISTALHTITDHQSGGPTSGRQ